MCIRDRYYTDIMTSAGDAIRFDWRRGGAAAGALVAVLLLLGLVFLVAWSNGERDKALELERHAYDVTLLTRSIDASVSRADTGLGQFALDEDVKTGNIYYSYWQLAGRQIQQLKSSASANAEQQQRLKDLQDIYSKLGGKFDNVARVVTTRKGDLGVSYYYRAVKI